MPHSDFTHLHLHTQYSLLDGACLLDELIKLAREYKFTSLAMTDHGNMFGAIEFYQKAIRAGIKPIIGCEVYIAPGSRLEKTTSQILEASFHLILLAKDETGYKNLIRLVSAGYLEGFYYRPRIDKEILAKYSSGLVCLTACLQGEIPYLILQGKKEEAARVAGFFKDIFKKDFYLEVQDNRLEDQLRVNKALVELSKKTDIPLVATNDVHYLLKQHALPHEILLCIQTQTTIDDPQHLRFEKDEFYLKTEEGMKIAFREIPEAISNTVQIAERCNLELDFTKTYLPHYAAPEGKTREQYLRELCIEGLSKKYEGVDPQAAIKVLERLDYELNAIKQAKLTSYFLIVWDFVHYAKKNHIPVGPGRGSAAGSLVSYCLDITDIDPLKYNLLFERFLNPERQNLPDIDIDFCYERRQEVIDYVTKKYGEYNVAQIITFGTMQARAAVRDVGRSLNIPYGEVDRIAKLIPFDPNMTLKLAFEQEPELKNLYKSQEKVKRLIDIAEVLEGLSRHASTHAAGVVISEVPLTEHIPLFKTGDGPVTTGFPMESLEKIGLLKMDFLGLRTLTVIDETVKIIKRIKGIDIDISRISLTDEKTYQLLSNGETFGVFQLESSGMRDLIKKMQPEKFEDIVAILALFRPGPLGSGMADDFIKRKHGKIRVKFDHRLLEPILKDTYGIMLYQEQVMMIVSELAGFSLSQADTLRRAMAKKEPEIMERLKKLFIDGTRKNKIDEKVAEKIFGQIEYFAGYGFNRSHSAAYALISYRTAYLKANFPVEFMTALLTSERENIDKVAVYKEEAERMAIKVLPPDVNESFAKFTVTPDQQIRFGLAAVKNVGQGAIDSIIRAREKWGRFDTIYDFCEKVDLRLVNRKVLESLIKCGAFNSFKLFRSQLMAILDEALEMAQSLQRDRNNGQMSLFSSTFREDMRFRNRLRQIPNLKEWPESQLLAFEKEMLGFYITGHPLAKFEKLLRVFSSHTTEDLKALREEQEVSVGGIISKAKHTLTKKKAEKMAIISLEDLKGEVETLIFPEVYKNVEYILKTDGIVIVKGKISLRDELPKIIASDVIPIEDARTRLTKSICIDVLPQGTDEGLLTKLRLLLVRHQGEIPVFIKINYSNNPTKILVERNYYVKPTDSFLDEVESLLGEGVVSFDTKN